MATPSPEELLAFQQRVGGPTDSRVGLLLKIEIPLIVITVAVVCLRFYVRAFVKRKLGLDDWMMGLALMFTATETALNCVATKFGIGQHVWNVRPSVISMGSKLGWIYHVLYPPSVNLCKISILLTYLRIFPSQIDRRFCQWWIIILTLATVGVVVSAVLQCLPINSYWDLTITDKICYDQKTNLIVTTAINTASDLAVFLWPAPRLWTIKLPLRQRLGLIFVFNLGCIVCVAGIFRIYYSHVYFASKDVFYNAAILFILGSVECNVGIICGSLPEIRPLFAQLITRLESSIALTRIRYGYHGAAHPSNFQQPPLPEFRNEKRFGGPSRTPGSLEALDSFDHPGRIVPEPKKIHIRDGRTYSVLDDPKDSSEDLVKKH